MEGHASEASHLIQVEEAGYEEVQRKNSEEMHEESTAAERSAEVYENWGLHTWHELISRADSLEAVGCVLAWVVVQAEALEIIGDTARFLRSIFEEGCESHGPLPRKRGAIFPLRAGRLELLRTVLKGLSMDQVSCPGFIAAWFEDCWLFCVFTAINGLALKPRPLPLGAWSAAEERSVFLAKRYVLCILSIPGSRTMEKTSILQPPHQRGFHWPRPP